MKFNLLVITLVGILVLFSVTCCSNLFSAPDLPTLIPTEQILTVVAQTVQAMGSEPASTTKDLVAGSTVNQDSVGQRLGLDVRDKTIECERLSVVERALPRGWIE